MNGSECKHPLKSSDFAIYDANGNGTLEEVTGEKLACLAEQYVNTKIAGDRIPFRDGTPQNAKEALRAEIIKVAKSLPAEHPLQERIRLILETEIRTQAVGYDIYLIDRIDQTSVSRSAMDGTVSAQRTSKNSLTWANAFRFRLDLDDQYKVLIDPRLDFNLATATQTVGETENKSQSLGILPSSGISLSSTDKSVTASLYFDWRDYFLNLPPDSLDDDLRAKAAFVYQAPVFTLRSNLSYLSQDYTPPNPELKLNPRGTQTLSIDTDAAFLQQSPEGASQWGGFARFIFQDNTAQTYLGTQTVRSLRGDALAQLTEDRNYLRLGGGARAIDGVETQVGLTEPNDLGSADGHVTVEGQWKPKAGSVALLAGANFYVQKGSGTIDEIYPSWDGKLDLRYEGKALNLKLVGAYEGHRVGGEEHRQDRHSVSGGLEATYQPVEGIRFIPALQAQYTAVEGFRESSKTFLSAFLNVSWRNIVADGFHALVFGGFTQEDLQTAQGNATRARNAYIVGQLSYQLD